MCLPSRSFGVLTALRLTVMKPWRKTREGNTGSATISLRPAASRLKTSELDISQASKSIFPHTVENLPRLVDGEKVEIDTFGFDLASMERRHAVIEAAGERHRNFGHDMAPARSIPDLAETLFRLQGHRAMPLAAG